MASTIAAITTGIGGIVTTADATGNLSLLSGTSTVVAVTSAGAAVTGTMSVSGATTLTGGLTTPLAVTSGGTGLGTLTANNVILGAGTSIPTFVAPSTSGNVLTSNGTTWTSAASSGGVTTFAGGTTGLTPAGATSGAVTLAGTLAVANGGTGVTTSTGSGANVLGTSPTLTTPVINGFTGNTSAINIGSGQVYKDASGNVGIGTASPATKLNLLTPSATAVEVRMGNSVSYAALQVDASGYSQLLAPGGVQIFSTNGSEKMRIDSSGNVGIGTTAPANKLEVFGDGQRNVARASTTAGEVLIEAQVSNYWSTPTYTGTSLRQSGSTATGTYAGLSNANLGSLIFQNGSVGLIATNGGTPIVLATSSIERMRIDSSGNVGIGTATPGEKLDVSGNIRLSGSDTYIKFINAGGYDFTIRGNNGGSLDFISPEFSATPIASMTNAGVFQFNSGYGSAATAYGCRAWVNFNGTGTVAIRASGNVSSITDDGTGLYRINFTTAMVDANYATNVTMNGNSDTANTFSTNTGTNSFGTTTTYSAITTKFNGGPYDSPYVLVSVFR